MNNKYNLNSNNYYEILGVKMDDDIKTIKKAYQFLAIKYHPDKNLDDVDKYTKIFCKIKQAYITLTNLYEKNNYDNSIKNNNFSNNYNFSNKKNNNDIFNDFFNEYNSNENIFTNNSFSFNFSNINDDNIDINSNYSIYNNFHDEYNNVKKNLNDFKNKEYDFFNNFNKNNVFRIPNSTKVLIISLNIYGYIKDFQNNSYIINSDDGVDYNINFENIQQILKGKFIDLKGDYSHLNDEFTDILKYDLDHNKFFVYIFGCELIVNLENIIINNNSFVKIFNLINKKELNNLWGIILAYDYNTKKYIIKLENNKIIKVNYKNIVF